MDLLLYKTLGFIAIALSLLGFARSWAEKKTDEAYNLLMNVRPPAELIGMKGRCAVVHWYTAYRYYRYKYSVWLRIWGKVLILTIVSSLLALLCTISVGIIKLFN